MNKLKIGDTIKRGCHGDYIVGKIVVFLGNGSSYRAISIFGKVASCCAGQIKESNYQILSVAKEYIGQYYFSGTTADAIKIDSCSKCLEI